MRVDEKNSNARDYCSNKIVCMSLGVIHITPINKKVEINDSEL